MARQTPCPIPFQYLIFLLIVTPLIASGVALMVLFLPLSPKFQVVSFQVSPIMLTPIDDDSILMSATWNLTFIARNPNRRLQLYYNDVDVSLSYKWIKLSSQRLGFFKQRAKSEDVVHATVSTKSGLLSNKIMAAMEKDGQEDLAVNFNVKLRGTVRVYIGSKMGINHALSINCDDVKVGFFPQNGTGLMLGDSRQCYSNKLIF